MFFYYLANYALFFSPLILLILFSLLKTKHIPNKQNLNRNIISLFPGQLLFFFFQVSIIFQTIWSHSSVIGIRYSEMSFEVFISLFYLLSLTFIFVLMRYKYNSSLFSIFNISQSFLPFILKPWIVLTIPCLFLVYLSGIEFSEGLQIENQKYISNLSSGTFVLFLVNTIILAPIIEEFIFRGLLYVPIYRKLGRIPAMILTAFIFSMSHFLVFIESVPGAISQFLMGLFLVWLYDRKGTLVYPVVSHAFINIWVLFAYLN